MVLKTALHQSLHSLKIFFLTRRFTGLSHPQTKLMNGKYIQYHEKQRKSSPPTFPSRIGFVVAGKF